MMLEKVFIRCLQVYFIAKFCRKEIWDVVC